MADSALEATPKRKPDYSRLTRDEVAALLALHKAGKTQVEIAHILGCDHSNVSRWLDKLVDTREVAKHTLHNSAQELVERVVKDANVAESLDVLERIEVIAPKKDGGSRTGVQIVVCTPGQTQVQAPAIEAEVLSLSPAVSEDMHRLTADSSGESV